MIPNNSQLDAVRGALILLVVWGHLLESEGFYGSFYFAIYIFHIPAFSFISGMLSKPRLSAKNVVGIITRLLVPLIIFQIIYFFVLGYFAPDRLGSVYAPVWIIWFLFSLAIWKLVLPLVLRLTFPLLWSMGAALLAGYVDFIGPDFSFSRTLVFFPAFLIGHLYGTQVFLAVKEYQRLCAAVFLCVFFIAILLPNSIDIRWLWGSQPYTVMVHNAPSILLRAGVIAVGVITTIGFFALIPARSQFLIALGRNTMPIFLFHGIPVVLFWASGMHLENHVLFLVFTLLLAVAISVVIMWASTRISTKPADPLGSD